MKDRTDLDYIKFINVSVTRDMITMPLQKWQGDPIGVVQVMNKRHGQLDEQDVGILTITCGLTALAIEQNRLFEQTKDAEVAQERTRVLTEAQDRKSVV